MDDAESTQQYEAASPVRVRPVAPADPSIGRSLARTGLLFMGRAAIYGGGAAIMFTIGALWGIWWSAGEQELPETVRQSGLLASYVEQVDARRDTVETTEEWRQAMDSRLKGMHSDLQLLRAAVDSGQGRGDSPAKPFEILGIDELGQRLTDHDLQSRYNGDIRWCTTLFFNGHTADACDGLDLGIRAREATEPKP